MHEHENDIAKEIVDAAYCLHTRLGSGLLESVYETVLAYELRKRNLHVTVQQPVAIEYEDIKMETGFRADLIVGHKVIVELKSVEKVIPVHKKQLLTYVRLTDLRLGLLINFGESLIKDGITRIVNNLSRLCERQYHAHAKTPRTEKNLSAFARGLLRLVAVSPPRLTLTRRPCYIRADPNSPPLVRNAFSSSLEPLT